MDQPPEFSIGGEMFKNSVVTIGKTEIVNWNFEFSFMYFTVPIYIATLLLNMSVLIILWKTEKTIVNQLIMLDCIVSIMLSSLYTFPYYRGLGMEAYCYSHLVLFWASVACNRLLPVSIVVYRYEQRI